MLDKIKRDAVQAAVRWAAGGIFREIAEGKRGPKLQKWYLAARGYKTATGGLLALLVAGFMFAAPQTASSTLATPLFGAAAGVLIVGGLIDKAWMVQPPPTWFMDALHEVMSYGPLLSGIVAALTQFLPLVPGCEQCQAAVFYIDVGSGAVASATGWLAAYCAKPHASVPPAAQE